MDALGDTTKTGRLCMEHVVDKVRFVAEHNALEPFMRLVLAVVFVCGVPEFHVVVHQVVWGTSVFMIVCTAQEGNKKVRGCLCIYVCGECLCVERVEDTYHQ